MADDIVERLRRVATEHPDKEARKKAAVYLHRMNETVSGKGTFRESLKGSMAKNKEKVAAARVDEAKYRDGHLGGVIPLTVEGAAETGRDLLDAFTYGADRWADTASLGAVPAIQDAIDPSQKEARERRARKWGALDRETGGHLGAGGTMAGMSMGAPAAVAKGVGQLAKLAPAARGAMATPVAAATLAAEGAVTGGAVEGGRSAIEGNGLNQIVDDAGSGAAWGAGANLLFAGAAGAARKARDVVRDPRSRLGRSIQARDKAAPFLKERKDLPKSKGDAANQLADEEFQAMKAASETRKSAASGRYDSLTRALRDGDDMIDAAPVRQRIAELRAQNTIGDTVINPQLDRQLMAVENALQPAEFGGKVKVADVLKLRDKFAVKPGAPMNEITSAQKDIRSGLTEALDAADPEGKFAQARAGYKAAMDKERSINELLTGKGRDSLEDAAGNAVMSEAGRLKTMATSGGIGTAGRLGRELRSVSPEAGPAMDRIAGAQAASDLRIGVPDSPSLSRVVQKNAGRVADIGQKSAGVTGDVLEATRPAATVTAPNVPGALFPPTVADHMINVRAMEADLTQLQGPAKLKAAAKVSRDNDREAARKLMRLRRRKSRKRRKAQHELDARTYDPITGESMAEPEPPTRTYDPITGDEIQ